MFDKSRINAKHIVLQILKWIQSYLGSEGFKLYKYQLSRRGEYPGTVDGRDRRLPTDMQGQGV
jgi:hypothetical protein